MAIPIPSLSLNDSGPTESGRGHITPTINMAGLDFGSSGDSSPAWLIPAAAAAAAVAVFVLLKRG